MRLSFFQGAGRPPAIRALRENQLRPQVKRLKLIYYNMRQIPAYIRRNK